MSCGRLPLVVLLAGASPAAYAVTIAHEGAGCVVADRFPSFEARLDPASEVARARASTAPPSAAGTTRARRAAAGAPGRC